MLIREVQQDDYAAMVLLLKQLGYGDNSVAGLTERYPVYKANGGIVYVYETSDRGVIGFISLAVIPLIHCDGFLGRVTALCVEEAERSRGIGKELLQYGEDYFRKQQCVMVEVTTRTVRKDAQRFYIQNGWEETHKRFNKNI